MHAQSDISHVYEDVVKNFTAKRVYDKLLTKDFINNKTAVWGAILDTNEYYPVTFIKINDSAGVFRNNLTLYSFRGFRNVHIRLSCDETIENLNISYAIKAGTPFPGFENHMNKGIVAVDSLRGETVFISGALFINSKVLLEKYVEPDFNPFDYIKLRYFNYEPIEIKKVESHYEFQSNLAGKHYRLWLDHENFKETLEEK